MKWYALFVETGKEDIVRSAIQQQFDSSIVMPIVPKRRLREKRDGVFYEINRILFPGYVFIKAQMSVDTYYGLKKIPRCYKLLNKYKYDEQYTGKSEEANAAPTSLFSQIDEEEMTLITQLMDHDEIINYSVLYVENARSQVRSGPLKGKEGMIKKIDKRKKRARIVLELMGKSIEVDVGVEVLSPPEVH